ncbi:MAG: PadR family transcriptional regulator [Candidatus Heimdallarchaeaceae archaeon]
MQFIVKSFLKGLLEFYILLILSKGSTYGYDLTKKIEDMTGFWKPSPGSIYPALSKLKKKNLIKVKKQKRRIYYQITKKGEIFLKNFKESRSELAKNMEKIIENLKR